MPISSSTGARGRGGGGVGEQVDDLEEIADGLVTPAKLDPTALNWQEDGNSPVDTAVPYDGTRAEYKYTLASTWDLIRVRIYRLHPESGTQWRWDISNSDSSWWFIDHSGNQRQGKASLILTSYGSGRDQPMTLFMAGTWQTSFGYRMQLLSPERDNTNGATVGGHANFASPLQEFNIRAGGAGYDLQMDVFGANV